VVQEGTAVKNGKRTLQTEEALIEGGRGGIQDEDEVAAKKNGGDAYLPSSNKRVIRWGGKNKSAKNSRDRDYEKDKKGGSQ